MTNSSIDSLRLAIAQMESVAQDALLIIDTLLDRIRDLEDENQRLRGNAANTQNSTAADPARWNDYGDYDGE